MPVKNDSPLQNAQILSWRALWERLLGYRGEELLEQRQSSERTDLNISDGDTQQSAAQKHGLHDDV
jgi:hypothetical protein